MRRTGAGARRTARRGRGGRRRLAWLVAAAIVTGTLAGCAGHGPGQHAAPPPPTPPSITPGSATWMLTRPALAQMLADPAVRSRLEHTRIYELLQPGQQPLSGVAATPVVTFPALAELRDAVTGHTLPAGTGAVLYDPEAWSFTPPAEQRNPVQAAAQAAQVAHAHGLKLIVAPALNLTTVMDPGSSLPRWKCYLELGLARSMARVADVVELQAQSLERDQAVYESFVRQAAAQARAANPRVSVLAGLSTNPPGAPVGSQQLTAAYQASRPAVDGYWLNIPGQGARCPTCNAARPDIGVKVLTTVL